MAPITYLLAEPDSYGKCGGYGCVACEKGRLDMRRALVRRALLKGMLDMRIVSDSLFTTLSSGMLGFFNPRFADRYE